MRDVVRAYIWSYLTKHPCVDCGETDSIVLEFDHISSKNNDIASLIRMGALEQAKEEIKKCQVRCANCHRRITAIRAGWTKKFALVA